MKINSRYNRICQCIFLSFFFCFFNISTALSSFIMDDIDMSEIKDMQLRKVKDIYYMDVIIMVKNSNKRDIELRNCDLNIAFAVEDTDNINLGTAAKDTVIFSTASKTELPLTVTIGENIEALHLNIISSDEMNALLTAPYPELNLNIQGKFDAGVRAKMGWTYEQGLNIDWFIKAKIPRKILMAAYKSIESAADKQRGPASEEDEDIFFLAELKKNEKKNEPDEKNDIIPEPEIKQERPFPEKITIYFKWGQKNLSQENKNVLKNWAHTVGDVSENLLLHIEGHTDADGHPKNKEISEKRALLVEKYLVNDLKFKKTNIHIAGFGEEKPIVVGNDKEANDKNRRVELYFSDS